jgi:hypothetical protein
MKKPPEGTLCLSNPDARESVIKALQVITGRYSPGHPEYERADHAVELALSPGRAAKSAPFLMRNVDRDARRTLKKQNENPGPVFLSSLEAALNKKPDGDAAPASVETVLPAASTPEPIDELIADELEGMVRKAIENVPNGDVCLDAMLDNESLGDTAKRLGLPVHTVWRTRTVIRERAQFLLA